MTKPNSPGSNLSRRGFIGGSASAAFAIMKPATALGSAANSRVTAGIIGLGGRGMMIARMVRDHGGYEITAMADYFPDVVEDTGEKFEVKKKHRFSGLMGYQGLFDTKPDAVFLETPPYCFPEHTKAAVEAGRHVYIAKPLGCDVPGCLAIAEAGFRASASQRVFLVDFQTRTDPFFIEGVQRIRNGDFGAVGLISSLYADEAFRDPPLTETIESRLQHLTWVNDIAIGGGYLVNAGIHAVDVALWIAGEQPVSAMGSSRVVRADPHGDSRDVYSITYQFANGLVVNHHGEHLKNRHTFKCECIAHCQEGYLEAGYAGQVRILGIRDGYRGGKVEGLYQKGAERNIDEFHKCIVDGNYDNPTIGPGVNATLATILGRDAAQRNGSLTWDAMMEENTRLEVDLSGLTM